jgi:hypothetical protein
VPRRSAEALGFGTLSSDTLSLNVPENSGQLGTDVFHPATPADYNNAVAATQSIVAQANASSP